MPWEKFLDNLYITRQNIRNHLSALLYRLYIKIYLVSIAIVNVTIWLFARFIISRIGAKQMALHYNVDFGIDYYGDVNNVFIIPALGLLIIFVNTFLYTVTFSYRDRIFVSHLLFSSALFANVILLAAVVSVYLVNFK